MQDEPDGARPDQLPDPLMVAFQGDRIECRSIEEAILLKNASLVIRDGAAYTFTAAELDDMIKVLVRLQRVDAAETIIRLRSQMLAARYVASAVGDKRPNQLGSA